MKGEKFVAVVVVVRVVDAVAVAYVAVVAVDAVSIRQNKVFLLLHFFLLKTFEKVGAAISLFFSPKEFHECLVRFQFRRIKFFSDLSQKTASCFSTS